MLLSAFNDELDEYRKEYSIHPLPDSFAPVLSGSPWKFLEELELNYIAIVPVNSVQFDHSKRKKLDTSALLEALQLKDSR